ADEEHSLSKSKKLTRQEDHVSQIAADLDAGGSVALQAGQNLAVISSRRRRGVLGQRKPSVTKSLM
ncbi:filamentous hemagglutinin family protein, partial [Pseudomonas syringae pv. actinidiae ICMP 19095]